jgi:predicted peptidase
MANIYKPLGSVPGSPYGFLYPDNVPNPKYLIGCLHGIGERGNGKGELTRLERNAAAKMGKECKWRRTDLLPVSPQFPATSDRFYHETLHKFFIAVIKHFNLPSEIFIMGLSAGARSANEYIAMLATNNAKFPNEPQIKVKAAVLIAGVGDPNLSNKYDTDTRLWAVHGDEDQYPKSFSENLVKNFNKRSPKEEAKYIEIPFGGHGPEVWDRTYQSNRVYDWMLKLT